ncbi:MAG: ABC transporter permease [Clostridia bacterium BRH_c25]|nr:MAG: ABC transporter permease [Clostridia bacterium BRH_c25]
MELLILLLIMLFFFMMKMPVAFSIGITAVIALIQRGLPLELVPQRMFTAIDSFALLAVPVFIFVGEIMNTGGVTQRLFNFCRVYVRHIAGGLGHVNVMASVIFAGMSGSAVADAQGLGAVELKAMRDAGYDDEFSGAITAASSTIGPIIPPSIPLVIYAVLAEQSVGRLFLGGLVPGVLMGSALCVMVYFYAKKRGYPIEPKAGFKEKVTATYKAIPSLLTPIIIIGAIMTGIISPTEAATLSAVYALFLGFVLHKELTLKILYEMLNRTVIGSVTTLIIISSASILSWIVISSGAPTTIAHAMFGMTQNPIVLILLINLLLLVLGCFLEATSILMIMAPILLPIAEGMGFDLVAFGVIFVLNIMIGLITPPMGLCLFVVAKLTELPVSRLVRPTLIMMIPLVIVLLLISIFPQIITFLPNLLMGGGA